MPKTPLALWPPGTVAAWIVAPAVGALLLSGRGGYLIGLAAAVLFVIPLFVTSRWLYSAYALASLGRDRKPGFAPWLVFQIGLGAILVRAALGNAAPDALARRSAAGDLFSLLMLGMLLLLIWRAAWALCRRERDAPPQPRTVLIAAAAAVYLPVMVWYLRDRLAAALAPPPDADPSPSLVSGPRREP